MGHMLVESAATQPPLLSNNINNIPPGRYVYKLHHKPERKPAALRKLLAGLSLVSGTNNFFYHPFYVILSKGSGTGCRVSFLS